MGRTPDRNTLWRFDAVASPSARDELSKRGLAEALPGEVDRQLREKGLVMQRGSIVDATLVRSAAATRNRRRDGRAVDPDADWTARSGRDPTLGDELHVAVDEDTGIVRRIAFTPASRHERTVADAVVPGDAGRMWADAADDARDLREALEARGITAVIAHNPRRCGLRPWPRAVNVVVKTVRPRIEPVSGTLKRSFGLARARCFPLARNLVDVGFRVLASDLRRAVGLLRHATRPPGAESARSPRNGRENPRKTTPEAHGRNGSCVPATPHAPGRHTGRRCGKVSGGKPLNAYHGVESRSTTSRRLSTREQSSQRSAFGSTLLS